MAIPVSDQEMIEAIRAFVDQYDFFPFFSDDDPEGERLHELWDEWREADRDLPTPMMIEARFASMLNAFFVAGPWPELAEEESDRDPERPRPAISKEMFPTMLGALGMADVTLESRTIRAFVANGIVSLAWRNGPIETVHGGGGLEAIEDGDMMRINASLCRAVFDAISGDDLFDDLLAARRVILDPRRVLPTGETTWELAEGYVREVIDHANGEIAGLAAAGSARDPEDVYRFLTFRGINEHHWAGAPWWPFIVDAFLERIVDPEARFMPKEPPPALFADHEAARVALLSPDRLSAEEAAWAVWAGIGYSEGRDRWLEAGSPQDGAGFS